MKHAPLMLACLLGLPSGAYSPPPCAARLELRQEEQLLTLTGHCQSMLAESARYYYRLVVVRKGASGESQNTQAGEFLLPAQEERILSRVRLTAGTNDHYSVHLWVTDSAGQIVAQDSVASPL